MAFSYYEDSAIQLRDGKLILLILSDLYFALLKAFHPAGTEPNSSLIFLPSVFIEVVFSVCVGPEEKYIQKDLRKASVVWNRKERFWELDL